MHSLPRFSCLPLLNLKNPIASHHIKQIHAQLIINGLKEPSFLAKLIENYSFSPSPQNTKYAQLVYKHFDTQSLFLFNTLLRCSQPKVSIFTFANWVSKGNLVFDDFTFIFVLGACARSHSLSTLWLGRQIHKKALKFGVMSNLLVATTLIHFYANNKDILSARSVFDEMTERSSVTWNAMIKGYCSQKERAKECCREALLLFRDMLNDVSGVKPTDTTMVCVLSACSRLGELYSGACIHGFIEKAFFRPENDVFIGTGLVDMYAKCGCINSALCVFRLMRVKNVLTWTAMGAGLAVHGRGEEALELLDAMKGSGVEPNPVTFTSLFSACCHAGLVQEGLHLFHSMGGRFDVKPQIQHYGCIVDLLGRAGHLNEAYDFIIEMPMKPDAILWRSLLSACNVHGDVVMAEKVGKILLRLKPPNSYVDMAATSGDYVALSNVYASAKRWQQVEMVRKKMKLKRVETEPGGSSIQTISNHLDRL
ncbi:pentatricopeptide repeat-containing protein At3g18970 [Herrania umbratica]|uniref:Pentatricopeptide repeat-containing protein At3g18970 n=1 Tax=Herrania umbratica TaxID=108875 RepID=A0A6J1A4D0_9ROSI|nr:pentatricopeptide repeat-containing protein At3g18970 [Herrania umbratica]